MNKILRKVRPLGNLTDIYYTYSHWKTKNIDGIEFIAVAKLDPVYLGGVTVSSISVHNEDYIKEKDLKIFKTGT